MDEHVIRTYVRAEPVFVTGRGAEVIDEQGREYLDLLGGIAVSALGHGHPGLTAALHEQVDGLLHVSNLYRHPYTEEVAGLLAELSGLEAVFFCNSGAESVEAALKLARKHQKQRGEPERTGFVALENSFHGRTMGALSVTHTAKYREPFAPLVPGVTFVPAGDTAALAAALDAKPAALILEPIQGESGVREISHDYLRLARHLCDETGTILIHDEVQCGSGRTGKFLAGDHANVKPDVATLAKPLAAGLPMGAMLVRAELAETLVPGDHGSTFGGGPLVSRAALVFLHALKDGLLEQVSRTGARLRAGLERLAGEFPIVREVRGRGLMLGIRLEHGAAELQRVLFGEGLIANCCAGDVVRFLPPYVITEPQVDRALEIVRSGLQEIDRGDS